MFASLHSKAKLARSDELKRWLLWLLAAVGVAVVAVYLAPVIMERGYQAGAKDKRVNDTHKIAEAIEVYRSQTGALPYAKKGRPKGYEEVPVVVRIVSPASDGSLAFGPPPFQLSTFVDVSGPRFSARLSQANGAPVRVPVDPQRVPNGRPNAYYVIFTPEGGYAVLSFLRQSLPGSTAFGRQAYIYSVGRDWPAGRVAGLNIKPIATGSLSARQREVIAVAGRAADQRFGRYVPVTIEGAFSN